MKIFLLVSLILVMTILGATASYFFKKASTQNGIIMMMKDFSLYVGAFLYIIAACLNVITLRFLDYSLVLPLTSITYIWTMIISYYFLHERITKRKVIGVCCIITGVLILVT